MEPIKPSKTVKVYQLIKQGGMYFSNTGGTSTSGLGLGFYSTLNEAEMNRTAEILKANSEDRKSTRLNSSH